MKFLIALALIIVSVQAVAVEQTKGAFVDKLLDESAQEDFAQYVGDNFQLSDQEKRGLPLLLVGVEIEEEFIWVYQETPIPNQLDRLAEINTTLLDLLPAQVNTVNVECSGELTTLVFSGAQRAGWADLDFSLCGRARP